jgi:tetratricopeptide (TPR) repeat protein
MLCRSAGLVCLFVVCMGAPAYAQDGFGALPEAQQRLWADTLVAADTQLKQGELEAAAQSFERAKAIYPDPRIAKKLADVYSKLARWDDAVDNLRDYAASLPAGAERERAEGQIVAINAKQGDLEILTTPEGVLVSVYAVGADQPKLRRSTPMELVAMPPGDYRVTFEREGFVSHEERVTLRRGDRATLRVSLSEDQTGAPMATKVLGVTGIAAMAVGVGFLGYGAYKYYSIAPTGDGGFSRPEYNAAKAAGRKNMVIGGVTAGAGLILGGIGLYYWSLSEDQSTRATLRTGPGDVGVSLELSF